MGGAAEANHCAMVEELAGPLRVRRNVSLRLRSLLVSEQHRRQIRLINQRSGTVGECLAAHGLSLGNGAASDHEVPCQRNRP